MHCKPHICSIGISNWTFPFVMNCFVTVLRTTNNKTIFRCNMYEKQLEEKRLERQM